MTPRQTMRLRTIFLQNPFLDDCEICQANAAKLTTLLGMLSELSESEVDEHLDLYEKRLREGMQ